MGSITFPPIIHQLGNRPNRGASKADKERKIGHRRVGEGGEITYKKIQTSQIMGSIQLGIQHTVRWGKGKLGFGNKIYIFGCAVLVVSRAKTYKIAIKCVCGIL